MDAIWSGKISGLEPSALLPTLSEIKTAAQPGWPIAYINPTAQGTSVLIYCHSGTQEHIFLEQYVEGPALRHVLAFAAIPFNAENVTYDVLGQRLLPIAEELGSELCRPLKEHIALLRSSRNDILGLTVVLCGHLTAGIPLGAATWEEEGKRVNLLDFVNIRYASSAFMASVSATMAKEMAKEMTGKTGRLLALANPILASPFDDFKLEDLPAAMQECTAVGKLFQEASRSIFSGIGANLAALQTMSGKTTHVLIASHGEGKSDKRGSTGL